MQLKLTKKIESKALKNIEQKYTQRLKRLVAKRVKKSQALVFNAAENLIKDAIQGSVVYKGLDGQFAGSQGYDLQAEFGLNNRNAKRALEIILRTLMATVNEKNIKVVAGKTLKELVRVRFEGVLDSDYYESRLDRDDEPFAYDSYSKRNPNRAPIRIRWMHWLLNAKSNISGTELIDKYTITYHLTPKSQLVSRSGRAIMITPERADRGRIRIRTRKYQFPSIAIPTKGKNFIEEIATDRRFRELLTDRLRKAMLRIFTRRQKIV